MKLVTFLKKSLKANTKQIILYLFFKKAKSQRSIKYSGPLIRNSLNLEIKNSKSLKSFKLKLNSSFLVNITNLAAL